MQLYKLFPRSLLSRRLSKFAATELKIDTGKQDLADSVELVIKALQERGLIAAA